MLLGNSGKLIPHYTVSHTRKLLFSESSTRQPETIYSRVLLKKIKGETLTEHDMKPPDENGKVTLKIWTSGSLSGGSE